MLAMLVKTMLGDSTFVQSRKNFSCMCFILKSEMFEIEDHMNRYRPRHSTRHMGVDLRVASALPIFSNMLCPNKFEAYNQETSRSGMTGMVLLMRLKVTLRIDLPTLGRCQQLVAGSVSGLVVKSMRIQKSLLGSH